MSDVRRILGPTAWCALEVLVADAGTPTPGGRAVTASVRSVAASLGVSKNTAQRALTVLRGAGLIRIDRQRRINGRFDAGGYVLNVPFERLPRAATPTPDEKPDRPRPQQKVLTGPSEAAEQLSLLTTDH